MRRLEFDQRISAITHNADLQVAKDLYPEMLRSLGVPEEDVDRNAAQAMRSIEAELEEAEQKRGEGKAYKLLENARDRMNRLIQVVDVFTGKPTSDNQNHQAKPPTELFKRE